MPSWISDGIISHTLSYHLTTATCCHNNTCHLCSDCSKCRQITMKIAACAVITELRLLLVGKGYACVLSLYRMSVSLGVPSMSWAKRWNLLPARQANYQQQKSKQVLCISCWCYNSYNNGQHKKFVVSFIFFNWGAITLGGLHLATVFPYISVLPLHPYG